MVFKGLLCRDVNEVALDTQLKTVSLQLLLCQQSTTTKPPTQQPISGSARGGVADSWQATGAERLPVHLLPAVRWLSLSNCLIEHQHNDLHNYYLLK